MLTHPCNIDPSDLTPTPKVKLELTLVYIIVCVLLLNMVSAYASKHHYVRTVLMIIF